VEGDDASDLPDDGEALGAGLADAECVGDAEGLGDAVDLGDGEELGDPVGLGDGEALGDAAGLGDDEGLGDAGGDALDTGLGEGDAVAACVGIEIKTAVTRASSPAPVRARSLRCLARQPVEIIDRTESSCCMYPTPPRTFTSTLRTHLTSVS